MKNDPRNHTNGHERKRGRRA